jgi:hypothetical protein
VRRSITWQSDLYVDISGRIAHNGILDISVLINAKIAGFSLFPRCEVQSIVSSRTWSARDNRRVPVPVNNEESAFKESELNSILLSVLIGCLRTCNRASSDFELVGISVGRGAVARMCSFRVSIRVYLRRWFYLPGSLLLLFRFCAHDTTRPLTTLTAGFTVTAAFILFNYCLPEEGDLETRTDNQPHRTAATVSGQRAVTKETLIDVLKVG